MATRSGGLCGLCRHRGAHTGRIASGLVVVRAPHRGSPAGRDRMVHLVKADSVKRIAFVQYTNPAAYPPLEHSSRLLADRGWEVLFLGSGSSGRADAFAFPPHPRIAVRRWRHQKRGWRQKVHYFAFSLWVLQQCRRHRAAWIYASDLLACPAALLAARVLGCRVIYHEHDSPPNDGSRFFRRLLAARRQLCQRAALAVLPNARRAEVFADLVEPRCPVRTVWNCP
ncbi:MAG: glycosyltransferase, partial [Gammaproteobacteria bacterium]|nr:glycosyltransferase [Gammaproteobacteria bacterium]